MKPSMALMRRVEAKRQEQFLRKLMQEAARHEDVEGSRGGLTREAVVDKLVELWRPTFPGPPPIQRVVAEELKLKDGEPRHIRNVYGPGKWPGVVAEARRRLGP